MLDDISEKEEEIKMIDIEKIKIDILRDALKDVADTIRAMDRKVQFIIGYNAIFLGFISTIFLKMNDLDMLKTDKSLLICLGMLTFIWLIYFMKILSTFSPYQNPLDVFDNDGDKNFSNSTFFITVKESSSINLSELIKNFDNQIEDEKSIKKLLYKEISKLSYIRDSRIERIKEALLFSKVFTIVFMSIIICAVIKNAVGG